MAAHVKPGGFADAASTGTRGGARHLHLDLRADSLRLFERFGYVEAARLPEVGRKFDRWRTQVVLLAVLDG